MSNGADFTVVSTAAMSALADTGGIDVDVYLPAESGGQPVLYKGSDARSDQVDLERLRTHGVTEIFVRAHDLRRCEEVLETRLSNLLADPSIPPADKAQIVHGTGTSIAREMLARPTTSAVTERISHLADNIISWVLANQHAAGYLLQMAGHERTIASHMHTVATLAILLGARVFGNDPVLLKALGFGGMLHDLGKLSVPKEILLKPGPLTREELQVLQQHPIESIRLLGEDSQVPTLARQIILQHHERIDGQGYPLGIGDDEILPASRVISIVDSFHAMIGRRVYREAMSAPDATRAMLLQAGKQFDADFLHAWADLCEEYGGIAQTSAAADGQTADPSIAARYEHASQKNAPRPISHRPARHACSNNKVVDCYYAGRLIDVTTAPNSFRACVHDISRGGICIYVLHPMYRGEVANLRIRGQKDELCIRSTVAWCRQHEANVYRVGLRFVERLDSDQLCSEAAVQPLGGYIPAAPATATGERARTPRPSSAKKSPAPEEGNSAMQRLGAIACLRSIPQDAQQTVVVLAMSSDAAVRLKTIDLLSRIGTRASREALLALLNDVNAEIRERTATTLGTDEMHEAGPALRLLLADRIESVRLAAAGALGRLGDWSGLRMVISILEHDGPSLRPAIRAFGEITGHRFSANREGIQSARRYLAAKKKTLLRRTTTAACA